MGRTEYPPIIVGSAVRMNVDPIVTTVNRRIGIGFVLRVDMLGSALVWFPQVKGRASFQLHLLRHFNEPAPR